MIYIAGPLFSEAQREFLEKIDSICGKLKFKTFLPHRDAGICDGKNEDEVFKRDLEALDKCSLVVANITLSEADAGTCWEIGYSYAKNIPIMGLIDDIRFDKTNFDLMLNKSVKIVRNLKELEDELSKVK